MIIRQQRHAKRAFSLVELLLVLVILGTLAAIVIPRFAGRSQQARITAAQSQISSFETALNSFEVDMGYYPSGSDGLKLLVEEPADANNWNGPYLPKGVPNDPWGKPYVYQFPGKQNTKGFDLASPGPDQKSGTDDDITNWSQQ